jgi:ATP-dependent DNA helicase RecG
MTRNIIKNLGLSESTTVEFKQSLSEMDDIIMVVAAFANTDGGRIYVGVSDVGEVIGLQRDN